MFNNASNYHEWTYLIIYHGSLTIFFISMEFYQPVDYNHILPGLLHVWIYHIHLRIIVFAVQWNRKQKAQRNHLHVLLGALFVSILQWRHNERDGVSNRRRLDYLLNRLFRRRSEKTSKIRVTGLCKGNPPVTATVVSPNKGSVTRKMFPFDDVIMHVWAKTRSNNCERSLLDNSIQNQVQAKPWTREFGC